MADTHTETFSGRVSAVTYNDGADFFIAKIVLDEGKSTVTAKGHFPGQVIVPGTWVCFEGTYTVHAVYGRQVSVIKSPVVPKTWTDDRILNILSAQGVGPTIRMSLSNHANGKALLEVLDSDSLPSELSFVTERWKAAKAHLYASAFLADAGVPASVIDRVWKKYSTDVEAIVTKNPWALVQVDGITFGKADEIAMKLGVPLDSPGRLCGAVLATMGDSFGDGHVYASMNDILSNVLTLIPNATDVSVAAAVKDLVRDDQMILDRVTLPGTVALYEPDLYEVECSVAAALVARLKMESKKDFRKLFARVGPQTEAAVNADASLKTVVRAALADWSAGSGVMLTEDQLRAALSALTDNVSLITGLPGAGKTTALRAVVTLLKDAGISFLLAAPTGIAAKRLSNVVNADASTIHRAFGARGKYEAEDREVAYEGFLGDGDGKKSSADTASWGFGPDNPHPAEILIVDETSMVDLNMINRILLGTRPDCRLVFVGDPYQLPSVGAGDVLGDLVESKVFPHVHLDRVFRQEGTSGIVLAAHAVHRGTAPESDGRDFVLLPASSEEEAASLILRISQKLYEKRENFQVLSPRHSGGAGVTALNDRIRSQLNPPMSGMSETKLGGSVVREGDRIIIVKNDYQKGVFNGDVGTIRRIDRAAKEIEASIFGIPGMPSATVRFSMSDAAKMLRLAYAQTIHKCVHPTTITWHDGGLHQIRHLPTDGTISAPDGLKTYHNKSEYPAGPLLKVKTEGGYVIYVTPEHGLDVWDRDQGRYVRKEAQEVKKNDWLYMVPGPSVSAERPPHQFDPVAGVKTPLILDEDFAEFLGMLLAFSKFWRCGFSTNMSPWLHTRMYSCGRNDVVLILDKINSGFLRHFGICPQILELDKPHCFRLFGNHVTHWLWQHFPEMYPEHGKGIPRLILASSRSIRRSFLRGYFLSSMTKYEVWDDTESLVDNIWIRCWSENANIAIRAMLLDEGIFARCRMKNNITIRGRSLDRFLSRIGFDHPDAARLANRARLTYPDDERVPLTSSEASVIYRQGKFTGAPVDIAVRHIPMLGIRARHHHERIVSVVPSWGPSMCVEVPGTHKFIQNGFSGWNSQGQEYDVIVLPLLATFGRQLQRNLLYTAITRAKKRVLIVGQASAISKAVQNDSAEHRKTLLAARIVRSSLAGGFVFRPE